MTGRLVLGLDHVQWDARSLERIIAEIEREQPVWLRVANFFDRTLELLRHLRAPRLILWKLEFWGTDTPYDRVPASPGVDPARFTEKLLALGHYVVPYTFVEWNRPHLVGLAPALEDVGVRVLPLAQKPPVGGLGRGQVRRRFGIEEDAFVYGVGGLLHPGKGIEEVARGFARTCAASRTWLLASLVDDGAGETSESLCGRWTDMLSERAMGRVRLRVGTYGEWEWMCGFYRAVDVVLVNSVSESWGRMVSEPLGLEVPVLVRRAGCATNHLAPRTVLVHDFEDFTSPEFVQGVDQVKRRAPKLARYARDRYGLPQVRAQALDLLRAETPPQSRMVFDRLAYDSRAVADLDELLVF